jgi:hypothetical protein
MDFFQMIRLFPKRTGMKNYTSVEMIIIMHKYLQFFKDSASRLGWSMEINLTPFILKDQNIPLYIN